MFESSVNSDGTQTSKADSRRQVLFESSVNSDGTQTRGYAGPYNQPFESSVNSDGTQTILLWSKIYVSLRVV